MPSSIDATVTSALPLGREEMEVPFYNGSEHTRMTVYKDDLLKQINKEIGLSINHFGSPTGR